MPGNFPDFETICWLFVEYVHYSDRSSFAEISQNVARIAGYCREIHLPEINEFFRWDVINDVTSKNIFIVWEVCEIGERGKVKTRHICWSFVDLGVPSDLRKCTRHSRSKHPCGSVSERFESDLRSAAWKSFFSLEHSLHEILGQAIIWRKTLDKEPPKIYLQASREKDNTKMKSRKEKREKRK